MKNSIRYPPHQSSRVRSTPFLKQIISASFSLSSFALLDVTPDSAPASQNRERADAARLSSLTHAHRRPSSVTRNMCRNSSRLASLVDDFDLAHVQARDQQIDCYFSRVQHPFSIVQPFPPVIPLVRLASTRLGCLLSSARVVQSRGRMTKQSEFRSETMIRDERLEWIGFWTSRIGARERLTKDYVWTRVEICRF